MRIQSHKELLIYQKAVDHAMTIFVHTQGFPKQETYSLTDQIRRSSRSVTANIAEAWRKRRYKAAFISKMNDVEAEIAETQSWLEFAQKCEYLDEHVAGELDQQYESLMRSVVGMILHADDWCLKPPT